VKREDDNGDNGYASSVAMEDGDEEKEKRKRKKEGRVSECEYEQER
jgi:hypothetical protein